MEERVATRRDRGRSSLRSENNKETIAFPGPGMHQRMRPEKHLKVRKAKIADVGEIHRLVSSFASQNEMLHRPLTEICENLRDYFVATVANSLIGCCALHICGDDIAEIRSLAVAEGWQRQGVGTKLIQACRDEAFELGIDAIFALTAKPGVFDELGYSRPDVDTLPRLVWGECHRCAKFPKFCDEVPVFYRVRVAAKEAA